MSSGLVFWLVLGVILFTTLIRSTFGFGNALIALAVYLGGRIVVYLSQAIVNKAIFFGWQPAY